MDSWQDISTAPRDGTWVLLSGGEIDYGWDEESKPPCVSGQWVPGGWQFAWYDSGHYGVYENPTHWQALPSPPKAEGSLAGEEQGTAKP